MLGNNPHRVLNGIDFRTDINGLRAIAVLGVVLYHFDIPGFPGGFVGVDVFFVISGFLMASIIFGGLEEKRFDLLDFYIARARRIIPALIVVVTSTLAAGWFVLMPSDYQALGGDARESLFFTSNTRYLAEAGYFDRESHSKWLLHTWSLSVEWQFYLIYPLLLLALKKLKTSQKSIFIWHLFLWGASATLCFLLESSEPEKSFYSLHSRAWELLSGSCLFITGSRFSIKSNTSRILEIAGLISLAGSIFFIRSSMAWPSTLTIIPVAGTICILLAQRQCSNWSNLQLTKWIGARSYSIYLWHWPLVVGIGYFNQQSNLNWVFVALLCSVFFGHLSFQYIETPSRRWLSNKGNIATTLWIIVSLITVALASQIIRRSGIPQRLPESVQRVDSQKNNKNPRQKECLKAEAKCIYGGHNISATVLGDSHADAVITAIQAALPHTDDGIVFRGASGCLFVSDAKRIDGKHEKCDTLRELVLSEFSETFSEKPIFLINRTTVYINGDARTETSTEKPLVYFSEKPYSVTSKFKEEFRSHYLKTVCLLAKKQPVYLLRPIPEMPHDVPRDIGRELLMGRNGEVKLARSTYHQRHSFTWSVQDEAVKQCGAEILDPLPYLCDEVYCYGSENGLPLYSDDDHLNELGNKKLTPLFSKIFKKNPPQ